MQNYDLDAHLAELYDHYPEGTSRPVIGIVTNLPFVKFSINK